MSSAPTPSTPDAETVDRPALDDASRELHALSYEQAREELVSVVARLEAGGESLEGSLALWERGEALAARCQQWLDGARRRLEEVRAAHDSPPAGATAPDDGEDAR